jgi:hypothetical protein
VASQLTAEIDLRSVCRAMTQHARDTRSECRSRELVRHHAHGSLPSADGGVLLVPLEHAGGRPLHLIHAEQGAQEPGRQLGRVHARSGSLYVDGLWTFGVVQPAADPVGAGHGPAVQAVAQPDPARHPAAPSMATSSPGGGKRRRSLFLSGSWVIDDAFVMILLVSGYAIT